MITFNPQPTDDDFASLAQSLHDEETKPQKAPAPRVELQNISHVHEAIMNWMLVNPDKSLKQCAAEFGYTQAWLSTMIHSNLFQARLKEKQEQVFSGVATNINEKLVAGANMGMEKLVEHLEKSEDPKFIKETTTMMLDKLGFGASLRVGAPAPGNVSNVQNNFYMASPADLAQARGRISGGVLPSQQIAQGDATLSAVCTCPVSNLGRPHLVDCPQHVSEGA